VKEDSQRRIFQPDSNSLTGFPVGVSKSTAQGILEFGLTSTNPDSNCPPLRLTSVKKRKRIVRGVRGKLDQLL
jgi:hypothetical protein